jgi:hypothetical protein
MAAMQQGHVFRRLCKQGTVELASQMIDAGVNVDTPQEDGCTGLWLAAENGCTDVVKLLLLRKANPHALKTAGNISPLFIASQNGHTAAVELLLLHGANPSTCKASGASPLFIAAQQNFPEIVRALLRASANVAAVNHQGISPLMIAAYQGNMSVVRQLLAAGADPTAKGQGKDAVEWAAGSDGNHRGAVQAAVDDHMRRLEADVERRREELSNTDRLVSKYQQQQPAVAHVVAATPASAPQQHRPQQRTPSAREASSAVLESDVFQWYTPRYLGNSSTLGGASLAPHSPPRYTNTASFQDPLPSGVGRMAAPHVASGLGVTAERLEEEARRQKSFRSVVHRDNNMSRGDVAAGWASGVDGAPGRAGQLARDRTLYSTEQEWETHKERLHGLAGKMAAERGKVNDAWLYSKAATGKYAARLQDVQARASKAHHYNAEQMRQSASGSAGFVQPRLDPERLRQLKGFMDRGRGAQGPPPPLAPEEPAAPVAVAPADDFMAYASPAKAAFDEPASPTASEPSSPKKLTALERARLRKDKK